MRSKQLNFLHDATFIVGSEFVRRGHPDKVCDQISDGILQAILQQDDRARVACETMATAKRILLAGEITMSAKVSINPEKIVRKIVREIGYADDEMGLNYKTWPVENDIGQQSSDIAQGVIHDHDSKNRIRAGDQGLMYGFATAETEEYLSLPHVLSQKIAYRCDQIQSGEIKTTSQLNKYIWPDGKCQVTVKYAFGKPVCVTSVTVSIQHASWMKDIEVLRKNVFDEIILPVIPSGLLTPETEYYINHTGRFVTGGPTGDTGLTGRKIIVDSYGGAARHGGGAFSGKDPSKIDRSAAYYLRYVAKNAVAAGLAEKIEAHVSFSIAGITPLSLFIETFGTGHYSDTAIATAIHEVFDFRVGSMIEELDLRHAPFFDTSIRGHFFSDTYRWEQLDKIEPLKRAVKKNHKSS